MVTAQNPTGDLPFLHLSDLGAEAIQACEGQPPSAYEEDPAFAFDPDEHDLGETYSARWARALRDAGERTSWRVMSVPLLHEESTLEEREAYESNSRMVGGISFPPGCLDRYTDRAYSLLEDGSWEDALRWSTAGVNVLQAALPNPFRGHLSWRIVDNRAAMRVLYAYSSILAERHPRKAAPWLRALVFMDPVDSLGVRFEVPGAARSS